MGWPNPFAKKDGDAGSSKAGAAGDGKKAGKGAGGSERSVHGTATDLSAFSFGPTVKQGENMMIGVCSTATEEGTALEACSWTVKKADGDQPKVKLLFD